MKPDIANLLNYFELDDETDSHGSADMTNNNSVTFPAGKVGNAGQFVNASNQWLSNAAGITIADNLPWTVCGLMYFDSFPSFPTLCAKSSGNATRFFYYKTDNQFWGVTEGNVSNNWSQNWSTDEWHFVAIRCNGADINNMTAYFDGSLHPATRTDANSAIQINYIGKIAFFGTSVMDGRLDEISVWSDELTIPNLDWIYNGGDVRGYADLVGGAALRLSTRVGPRSRMRRGHL